MYNMVKPLLLKLFAVDPTPPQEPMGVSHDQVLRFNAAPAYLKYRLIGWVIATCVIGLGGLIMNIILFVSGEAAAIVVALILDIFMLGLIFWIYFVVRIDYDMRTYIVTDRSLRIREGAWMVREMTLTFANIQNVKVSQGPLERAFGIKNLEVETAGGGGQQPGNQGNPFSFHTGYLRGIENAEEIREMIRKRMERRPVKEKVPMPQPSQQGDELSLYADILAQVRRLNQKV